MNYGDVFVRAKRELQGHVRQSHWLPPGMADEE